MSTFNHIFFQQKPGQPLQPSPQLLSQNGPILQVVIEVPSALAQSMISKNQTVPPPVAGIAMIDTGASITSVDVSVLQRLGINPVGVAFVGTAGGPQQQSTYPAKFSFPGSPLPGFEHSQLLGSNLTGQTVLDQQPLIALIGRDLLSQFIFIYNGTVGMFSLSL